MFTGLRVNSFYFLLCASLLLCYSVVENSFIVKKIIIGDVLAPILLVYYIFFSKDFRFFLKSYYTNQYIKSLVFSYGLCCIIVVFGLARCYFVLGYIPAWALVNKGLGFLILGSYFVITLYLIDNLDRKKFMVYFLNFFIFVNASIFLYYIFFGHVNYLVDLRSFSGSLRNATATSFFVIYVSIYLCFIQEDKMKILYGKSNFFLFSFIFFLILATHSKVGILSFLIFFFIIALPTSKSKVFLFLSLICASCMWFFYRSYDSPKLFTVISELIYLNSSDAFFLKPNYIPKELILNDESMNVRLQIFLDASKLAFDEFLLGKGLGYFIINHYYHPDGHLGIHNTALWLLAEMGVFGLAAFILFYVRMLTPCYFAFKNGYARVFMFLCSGHFIFFTYSLVQEVMYQRILWVFFAVSISWYCKKKLTYSV